jgi:hypothetical protein
MIKRFCVVFDNEVAIITKAKKERRMIKQLNEAIYISQEDIARAI